MLKYNAPSNKASPSLSNVGSLAFGPKYLSSKLSYAVSAAVAEVAADVAEVAALVAEVDALVAKVDALTKQKEYLQSKLREKEINKIAKTTDGREMI